MKVRIAVGLGGTELGADAFAALVTDLARDKEQSVGTDSGRVLEARESSGRRSEDR